MEFVYLFISTQHPNSMHWEQPQQMRFLAVNWERALWLSIGTCVLREKLHCTDIRHTKSIWIFFCWGGYSEQLNVGIRMTHTYLQCSGNETGEQIHPTSIATPLFLQNDFFATMSFCNKKSATINSQNSTTAACQQWEILHWECDKFCFVIRSRAYFLKHPTENLTTCCTLDSDWIACQAETLKFDTFFRIWPTAAKFCGKI